MSAAIDGAGNAIAVFGSSYTWDLADGSWRTAGATSFGTGSGPRGSLGDLKIVPGHAVLLAADAVSAEPAS